MEGDGDQKKVQVVVKSQDYSFGKVIKSNLEAIAQSWTPALPENKEMSNYICIIIKIMMNKANINSGIEWKRVDWSESEDKLWSFQKYWYLKDPEMFALRENWQQLQVYKYLDSEKTALERKDIQKQCRTNNWGQLTGDDKDTVNNDIWVLMNFNLSWQEGLKIFRPSERESLETLWNVKLPEVPLFSDISTNQGRPPADIDPNFLNMDFVFTDVNQGKKCDTLGPIVKKGNIVYKRLNIDAYTCNWRRGPYAADQFEKIRETVKEDSLMNQ